MIRSLRRRHLWLIVTLGLVAGTLAVVGLFLRPEQAFQEELAPPLIEGVSYTEEARSSELK